MHSGFGKNAFFPNPPIFFSAVFTSGENPQEFSRNKNARKNEKERIRQRITLGNEVQWVTARTQRELIDNIIHLTLKHAEGCSSGGRKTHDFQSYATNWMKLYKENCLKHTTLREYASILKKHLIPAFGDTDISAITIDDVQRFMNSKWQLGIDCSA